MKSKDFFRKDNYYVIHNYGNGGEHIFKRDENYFYFLRKLEEYMSDNWQLIAWSLLPDRFTLLVKIKNGFPDSNSLEDINMKICKEFGHFANGYAKAINKEWKRRGSLFARRFSRKLVLRNDDLRKIICGIHFDPIQHNVVSSPADWKFSSYNKAIADLKDARNLEMIKFFENTEAFFADHQLIEKLRKVA